MTDIKKILHKWNSAGISSIDSSTYYQDKFQLEFDNKYEFTELVDIINNKVKHKRRAVDIGAGTGRLTNILRQYFEQVDAIEGAVNIYHVLADRNKSEPNVHVHNISMEEFVETEKTGYDLILVSGVFLFYHPSDVFSFIKKISNKLSQNGAILIRDFVNADHDLIIPSKFIQGEQMYYSTPKFWREVFDNNNFHSFSCTQTKPHRYYISNRICSAINQLGLKYLYILPPLNFYIKKKFHRMKHSFEKNIPGISVFIYGEKEEP